MKNRAIFGRTGKFPSLAIAALTAAIFVADASTHTGITVSVLYVVVVLMTAGSSSARTILLVSIGCAALTVTALFVAPPGPSFSIAVLNHGLSIAANATTTILVLRARSANTQLRERASLLELSHDAVFSLDMGAVITSWNRAAEELYGWPSEEAVGRNVHKLLETTFPEPLEDIYATLRRTGRWEGELLHQKRDGTQVIAASRWSLHHDGRGRPVAILETNNDVTEQRRATEELERSEAKYRNLFEHLPIAVVQTDTSELVKEFARLHAEGITDLNRYIDDHPDFLNRAASLVRVTQINSEAVKLFGPETAVEFMGNVARFFQADPGTMRRNAVARFSGEESITQEMRTVTLDGRTVHLLYKNTFSRALSEMGIGLLAMIDITERRQAQESLQQAQSDLARFNRVMLMGEMTASISHEINQPISGAITNANAAVHWLAADPPNIEEVRKSLERIVKDGHRASEVIGRVRALARKAPPLKVPLDINEAVGEVLALTERELHTNSVKVSVGLSLDLPLIPADRVQVQQVILNLVMNAIEAMSGMNKKQRHLSVSTGPESADVFVEVRDSGPGLEAAERDRLFQSFYTTKEGGMGLGLSLSRSIVEAHGGRLSVVPNEPNGAIFRFTLPVIDPSTADQDA